MTRPLIGIAADILKQEGGPERAFAYLTYLDSVQRAGGAPLILPPIASNAGEVLERIDGLLMVGGNDCDPAVFGEQPHPSIVLIDQRRQDHELKLARLSRAMRLPTLGICLGMQMMAIAAGGTLIQDIESQSPSPIRHTGPVGNRSRHEIATESGSRVEAIIGTSRCTVNSSHHQAIRSPGRGLLATAHADDGIIEAIEDPEHPFYVGVQWHPEDLSRERAADPLFRAFVTAAAERRTKRPELAGRNGIASKSPSFAPAEDL